jgi:hypothetical protein
MTPTYQSPSPQADIFDHVLLSIFFFGLITGIDIKLGAGLPIPAVVAGAAAAVMIIRRLSLITERHLLAMLILLLIYIASVLCATNYEMLGERFKGLIQLSYSIVIAYALYLTIILYDRDQLARIFMGACVIIIIGTALETYTGFRSVSDAFRAKVFSFGVYEADIRDVRLYGRIRPKFFTSEPSFISFAFLLFAFFWYAVSRMTGKLLVFFGLLGVGYVLMRGPTLMLGIPLAGAYELFVAPRYSGVNHGKISIGRLAFGVAACGILAATFIVAGSALFSERLYQLMSRGDVSFFYRIIGPTLITFDALQHYPLAGIGLTGEEFIENKLWQIYFTSPFVTVQYRTNPINTVLTNYFWLHWLYLGLGFGTLALICIYNWLKKLGVPCIAFCWIVWLTFGQSMGAYVSPRTWCVLMLAAAIAKLHELQPTHRMVMAQAPMMMRPVMMAPRPTA